jgi:hypothetical protein
MFEIQKYIETNEKYFKNVVLLKKKLYFCSPKMKE